MTAGDLLKHFRRAVFDENEPFLWSDLEFFEFANDAHEMFVRITGGIADSTSTLTSIIATASTEFTEISPLILKIRLVRRADFRTLDILNFEDIQGGQVEDDYGRIFNGGKLDDTEGPLKGMIVGMDEDQVRWFPIPAATETIQLTVDRMPLKNIINGGSKFEIPTRHHIHLLHWIRYRAYSKADAETFDKTRAGEGKNRFNDYVKGLAQVERTKRRHKYRTVAYGGL